MACIVKPGMDPVDSAFCKQAVVDFVKANPGCVSSQFTEPVDEKLAQDVKNWKRIQRTKREDGLVERTFDCKPFDDQLRALVISHTHWVCTVLIQGE